MINISAPENQQIAEFNALFEPTELHKDLVRHLLPHDRLGRILHSKFVIEPIYIESLNGMINMRYEQKLKAYASAVRLVDHQKRIWLCERPYRVAELRRILTSSHKVSLTSAIQMIKSVWIDTEDPMAQSEAWKFIFRRMKALGGTHFTDSHEWVRNHVTGKLKPIKVYRGWKTAGTENGWSWTKDYQKAIWFAKRFGSNDGMVSRGYMPTEKFLGYMGGRGEKEVIAKPGAVRILDRYPVAEFENFSKTKRNDF